MAAFQFGMMTGEFPMGWFMDRVGVRIGMATAVVWWSIATGLLGFARSGFTLGVSSVLDGYRGMRQLLGGVEDGERIAFPLHGASSPVGVLIAAVMVGANRASAGGVSGQPVWVSMGFCRTRSSGSYLGACLAGILQTGDGEQIPCRTRETLFER